MEPTATPAPNVLWKRRRDGDTLLIPLLLPSFLPFLLGRWPRHYVPLNCRHKQDGSLMSGQCGGRERSHFEVSKVTEFGNEEDIPDPQRERKPADLIAHSPTVMTNILTRCHNNGPAKISRYIHPTVASRSCGEESAETTGEVIPPTDRPFHAYERTEKQPYPPLSRPEFFLSCSW